MLRMYYCRCKISLEKKTEFALLENGKLWSLEHEGPRCTDFLDVGCSMEYFFFPDGEWFGLLELDTL